MGLIDQLWEFYEKHEWWQETRRSKEEIDHYHSTLIQQGNIITCSDGDILCGYVEAWRVSYEQFGRIICGEPFSALHENILNGQIAYLANTYIRPEYRRGEVYKMLRNRFFEANRDCTHFVGQARRKKSEPVKVFRRSQIMSLNKELV